MNSQNINLIISFLFLFVFCLFLNIPFKHILVIVLISCLVIFSFKTINDMNIYYNKRLNNISDNELNNYLISTNNNIKKINSNLVNNNKNLFKKNNRKITNNVLKNIKIENNKKPKYTIKNNPEIIPPQYYNQEDCTTDMSCIIKPDINNLGVKSKENIIKDEIKNNKIDNKDILNEENGLFIENFANKLTPLDLNDVKKEFNDDLILCNQKKNNYYEGDIKNYDSTDVYDEVGYIKNNSCTNDFSDLCFNCKVGFCKGGICKNYNEVNCNKIKKLRKKIIYENVNKIHPFSVNYPTIKITNPESRF